MIRYLLLFLILTITSCKDVKNSSKTQVTVYDGTKCYNIYILNCGATLYDCKNGAIYKCVQNVKVTTE